MKIKRRLVLMRHLLIENIWQLICGNKTDCAMIRVSIQRIGPHCREAKPPTVVNAQAVNASGPEQKALHDWSTRIAEQ